MLIISHRGNLSGPHSCHEENSITSIDNAILLGFDVEIDLWIINRDLFLGHDCPQYNIKAQYIISRIEKLWIHAKNIDAAIFCSQNKIRWFGHDHDDYVAVYNDNKIWMHPNFIKSGSRRNVIAVLPEMSRLTINDFNEVEGICTDYCLQYQQLFGMERLYKPVYELMKYRHQNKNRQYDSKLSLDDNRKCLAIYSWLDNTIWNENFTHLMTDLEKFKHSGFVYVPERSTSNGNLHFTFLQCSKFEDPIPIMDYDEVRKLLPGPFSIDWIQLIELQGSIILVGIPNIDINGYRNMIVNKFNIKEPYLNNIIHITLFRYKSIISDDGCGLKEVVSKYKDVDYFGRSLISNFNISEATLLMIF